MKRKIIKILVLILCCTLIISVVSLADSTESGVKNFKGTISSEADTSKDVIIKLIATILNIIRIVGMAIAIIMLMTVACKYIIASAGDRADIKKYAMNYVIGALVLFGASGIVTLAKNFIEESFES